MRKKPWRLNEELAAEWRDDGLYIFPYRMWDGEIRYKIGIPGVLLTDEAYYNLTNEGCQVFGRCIEGGVLKLDLGNLTN